MKLRIIKRGEYFVVQKWGLFGWWMSDIVNIAGLTIVHDILEEAEATVKRLQEQAVPDTVVKEYE